MIDNKLLDANAKKVAIKAELLTGANARKLAEKYDIHYTTVIKYRNEQRNGVASAEVLDVAEIQPEVIKLVAEGVKAKTTEALPMVQAKHVAMQVDELVEGVSSLQLLDTAFHDTITKLLTWANAQITDDMSMKDWRMIASQIGELHTAIFAKGGVQVNVQQNSTNNFASGMVN